MPIYHLEINDGERVTRDDGGTEYRDTHVAARELVSTLALVLHESRTESGNRDITGRIIDATGSEVYTATLALRCRTASIANPATNPNDQLPT